MLRAVLAGLILLNALFYCWTQGWLDEVVGIKAIGDREPERLARQIHPEQVIVLPPALPASQSASASAPATGVACLILGPLDGDAALATATQALTQAAIAPSQWRDQASELPGVWAVATIRLQSKDFQARKEATYKSMKIAYEDLQGPPEELPSLVLSRHPSEKAAAAALEAFSQRALKGLRVLALQAPVQRHRLLFAEADAALQAKLNGLNLAPGFKTCAIASPAGSAESASASAASAPSTPSSATPATRSPAPAASASPR